MKDYERQFNTWKKFYLFQESLEPPTLPESVKDFWDEQDHLVSSQRDATCRALEKDILTICRKYGYDPLGESAAEPWERYRETGRLHEWVARALDGLIKLNRALREDVSAMKVRNRKHGPERALSKNLAEVILVGLKLLEWSEPGLDLLRAYLRKRGLCSPTNTIMGTKKWKDEQLLYLQRVALSAGRRKVIKDFSGCQMEKKKLENRIAAKARDLAERSEELAA